MRTARLRRLVRSVLSDDTLSKKASLNVVAAMLDYGARLLIVLLLTPLLVSRLGDRTYGVYQLLIRMIGYATPAGGRPSQALKWTIARHQRSAAYEEKRLQVGSALAVWILFLPVLVVTGGLIAWFSPIILDLPQDLHTTVRVAAAFLVADLILINLLTIPQSVVQGENLGYKSMGLSTLVLFIGGGVTAAAVLLGAGLVGVTASLGATTVMMGAVFLRVARRNVAWFGVAKPPLRTIGTFLRLSGWFLAWNLVMQLMRASDVVVLGIAGSPELVTIYVLARYVPEAIFSVVAIVISAVMPGLGGLMGAGETERAANIRSESMAVTWLLATAAGTVFLVWQESFLGLWVGEEYFPGATTNVLIILMVLQFAFIRNDASIIDLTLQLRDKVLLGILAAGVSIALAVILIGELDLGIDGLAIGFIAGRSIVALTYPWLVCRSLSVSPIRQLGAAIRPLSLTALLFAAALAFSPLVTVHSWILLVLGTAASFAFCAATSFFGGLSRTQRARVTTRARQVVGGA
jgi:O-antigen/teichoic acid export membrane protein